MFKLNSINRLPKLINLVISRSQSGKVVDYTVKNGVAVVKFDNPLEKMNSLSEEVSILTRNIIREIESNSSITSAVLISGKTDNFIVGADIKMLEKVKTVEEGIKVSQEGQEMLQRLADSPKPIVAAIMGPCLGGGLEVAMAAHYRIAVKDKKTVLGLPEVMLGLLPGAGGTQRLPQLINVPEALSMMLTGKNCRPDKAKKLGLVDLTIDPLGPGLKPGPERTLEYLEEVAVDIAEQLASEKLKPKRKKPLMERLMRNAFRISYIRDMIFDKAKKEVIKKTRGLYPAPLKIITAIKTGIEKGSEAGFEAERRGFGELTQTPHSKALIGLFHGQTLCKKNRFGKPKKEIKSISVLGAGLMGAGIATVTIDKGIETVLKDMNSQGLTRGEQQIKKSFDDKVKRKRITTFERDVSLSNLVPSLDYNDIRNSDIVIEAVFEDINIKHRVVKEVEAVIRPDCIFASNTSALPIAKIAEASKRPENFVGMHYFSPVDKMPLLEVITTDKTSNEAVATAVAVGLKQGKVVITVKDAPAFYTTRILVFLMAEMFKQLAEGVDPKKLDQLTMDFGFPVGAVTLCDEVGMDTGMHIVEYLLSVFKDRVEGADPAMGRELISKGYAGRKVGKGFYLYNTGKKGSARELNPGALEILKKHRVDAKMTCTDEDLQMRLATRMVNEAILCLQEGIVANPLEGDVGAVFGLGFPPFRGGPFRWTDQLGADKMVQWMNKFAEVYGTQFQPCQLLLDHAKDPTKKFHISK